MTLTVIVRTKLHQTAMKNFDNYEDAVADIETMLRNFPEQINLIQIDLAGPLHIFESEASQFDSLAQPKEDS